MNWWFDFFGESDLSFLTAAWFIIVAVFGSALGIAYLLSH